MLIYDFQAPDPAPPLDCELPEGVTVEIDPEGLVTALGGELPEGCSALIVDGPNGQVNHGSFVSAAVHALKADFEGGMPFGRYVSQFANSDLGKGDDHVKGTDGDGGFASTESAKGPKPKNGHGKKGG